MAIVDMLPKMDDGALTNLRANAARLQDGAAGAQQKQAALLLPLIDAEMAERDARKPPKPVRAKPKPRVAKAS